MEQTCNPSTQEAEAGGLQVWGQLGYVGSCIPVLATKQDLVSKKKQTNKKKNLFETDENENIKYQNLQDKLKAVPRVKLIVLSTYIKKYEDIKLKNPTMQLKELEKLE
jgi:hypothetical protein